MTNPTFLMVVLNLAIIATIAMGIFLTHDPAMILGLFLLQGVPVVQNQSRAQPGESEPGEYDGGSMGFLS